MDFQNPAVNMFNIVEYGRYFLECLSINLTYTYAGMRLKDPDRIVGILSMSAGIPMTTLSPSDSLILSKAKQEHWKSGLLTKAIFGWNSANFPCCG